MTPPHGTRPLTDSDADLTAQPDPAERKREKQEAHMFECWNKSGGPGFELREKVDKLRLQAAGMGGLLAVLTVLGPVVLAWWLSSRFPAQQHQHASEPASFVKSAHAETKGTP